MKLFVFILFSVVFSVRIFSQSDSSTLVEYSPEFKFKEGIYLNFDQVKTNSPLPKSRIISEYDYSNPDFFERILEKDKIFYYDLLGNRKELKSKDIWGYSRNGFIYIKMEDGFFRITLIGAICHFIASQTTYSPTYNSPYYYSYMDPYRMYPSSYQTTEMRQYLLNFFTGDVLDYTDESLGVILMQDPELHDEYMALRKKKRKQMRFIYIRKFNERHPLYFPQN
jgi:hypothetical protein